MLDVKKNFLVVLFCAFTCCVFGPLELYFVNYSEFWFGIKEVGVIAIVSFFLVLLILCFLVLISGKLVNFDSTIIAAIIFLFTLSFYIQGNYVNADFGIMNGVQIDWEEYSLYSWISVVVWLVPILLYICAILRKKKEFFNKVIRIVSVGMVFMEVLTLLILIVTLRDNVLGGNKEQNVGNITNEYLFEFASDRNIVVLCLDSFDSSDYKKLIEDDSEYILEDFTYYPDTASTYPTTIGSIPYILTGKWYENSSTRFQYLEEAYEETCLYDELLENNYAIDIYTADSYVSDGAKQLLENVEMIDTKVESYSQFGLKYFKLMAFRYMPNQYKKYFWFYPGELEDMKKVVDGEYEAFSQDTQRFYDSLKESGCYINNDKINVFKFYHIEGMHQPYTFDENLETKEHATVQDACKGNLLLVKEFLAQIKNLGIYDNAEIIILADHGSGGFQSNPLLLIKRSGEKKNFEISEAPISYEDLMPTFRYLISEEQEQSTIFDVDEGDVRARRFLWYSWTADENFSTDYLPEMEEYFVKGKAYDQSSLYRGTHRYEKEKEVTLNDTYTFEDLKEVCFDGKPDFQALARSGFSTPQKDLDGKYYCWSLGKTSTLSLSFSEEMDTDILVEVDAGPATVDQKIIIYVDGEELETIANIKNGFSFQIPQIYLQRKEHIEITFEYPEKISGLELGSRSDRRELAFCFKKIKFSIAK